MPKFPKAFGRRKSNTITFEEVADTNVEAHSFKVFERPDGGSRSFDGGVKLAKATTGLNGRPKTSHLDDDNMFENLGNNRGSGASNTNTASTTDNSSRLSAASTAPSSTDAHGREEWRSAHRNPLSDIPVPPIPKTSSGFSLKTASRSLSWGRNKQPSPPKEARTPPREEEETTGRTRAATTSSYASTATPPKLEDKDLGLSLGGDFSDMFSGFSKRKSAIMDANMNRVTPPSPESLPPGPASRSLTNNRPNVPSHLTIDRNKEIESSPNSWNSQHSHEGLMSSSSPPPVPAHASPRNDDTLLFNRQQRHSGPEGLRRSSAFAARRQSTLEYGDAIDEDARLLQESVNASRRLNAPTYDAKVRDSWALPLTAQYKVDDATLASWVGGSAETTPRARKPLPVPQTLEDDNMFDSQFAASAIAAQKFQDKSLSPPTKQGSAQNKVMTPAQFERYKQDQDHLRSVGGKSKDDEDDEEDEIYEDEEDDAEKNKQIAKQRRKQEAHMVVYRQQMMKVTGETPSTTLRPPVFATQSSPNLAVPGPGEDGEEEDEEIPLAILQAHGFPNKNKPPMRSMGSNPNLRSGAMSAAGGVVDGRLPVFARNLPQDPYFGAGIAAPMNRESLAFSGGAGSVIGGPSRSLPPGGLVGVIATEERSRAMRRGSPNPQTGTYGTAPPSSFNDMGMQPSMTGSMYNGMSPGMSMGMGPMGPMGMPQMPQMMLTPGDQAQIQMSQQMQQFMQMQMQFMQMMTTGQGQPQQNGQMPPGFDMQRPGSAQQMRPGSSQQQHRAMSMLDPNAAPWMQYQQQRPGSIYTPSIRAQGGYAPSIAPSERSNIGLPGRYRPVSHVPPPDTKSRTSTMSGALQGWENKTGTSTIKPIKSSNLAISGDDEDDEEGWEEMAKKRKEKKSLWRTKKDKDSNGLREMLGFTTQ